MIHEAMILEYSGPPPGADRMGRDDEAALFFCLGIAVFCPWGIAACGESYRHGCWRVAAPGCQAGMLGALILVLIETGLAKMRLFRLTEYLGSAFLLATLGMLSFFILE